MKFEIKSDDNVPELIRQLRVAESILEYISSDLRGSGLPSLWRAVEGARSLAEELLFFFELSGGPSNLEGYLKFHVTKDKDRTWPVTTKQTWN